MPAVDGRRKQDYTVLIVVGLLSLTERPHAGCTDHDAFPNDTS